MSDATYGPMPKRRPTLADRLFLGMTFKDYVRSLATPFDVIAAVILLVGAPVIVWRFANGLASVTNLSQEVPWGLWIGFDMLCGVALAAGGFTLAAAVYMFGLRSYKPVVRAAILTGFLGYLLAVVGLLCDLGQPWRIPYPIFVRWGTTSVMFEVGWCVFLYTIVLALEFVPSFFEWMGWGILRRHVEKITVAVIVLGIVLSTLHQSSLGSLFLMAPHLVHPLWYSPLIPVFFFISAIAAGLTMVVVESGLSHRLFRDRVDPAKHVDVDALAIGLGRAAAVVLFAYFFLKLQGLADGGHWDLLATPWGAWFLVEMLGFVLLPSLLLAWGARNENVSAVRQGAILAVLGVVLNRLNVSVIAFAWDVPNRYVPSWMEILVSLVIVTAGVVAFRWIVNRMPVLGGSSMPAPER